MTIRKNIFVEYFRYINSIIKLLTLEKILETRRLSDIMRVCVCDCLLHESNYYSSIPGLIVLEYTLKKEKHSALKSQPSHEVFFLQSVYMRQY